MQEEISPKVMAIVGGCVLAIILFAVYWFFLKPAPPGIDITKVPPGAGAPPGWGPPPGSKAAGGVGPGVKRGANPKSGTPAVGASTAGKNGA